MLTVNEATGEVSVDLAGQTFRLHATLPRVAELQAALGVTGLSAINIYLARSDARAVYQGLRCLCSSGNAALFDSMLLGRVIGEATAAIFKALAAGLPEAEPGNASGNDGAPAAAT